MSSNRHNKEEDFYIGQSLENHKRWHYLRDLEQRKQDLIREELMRPVLAGDLMKSNWLMFGLSYAILASVMLVIATVAIGFNSLFVTSIGLVCAFYYMWRSYVLSKRIDEIDKRMR